ncbi:hypothetical protein BGV58_05595 [Burkholderia ubonensis]|nr:hypothetical protein WM02_07085 [Burkholderia ubonensis]ODQ42153.1 hypothetical protein BGV63_03930 [Burkholderia ubonensis]OJA32505.1 hypothetical protein BGV58_05595 [Burkholderia ubonensis]
MAIAKAGAVASRGLPRNGRHAISPSRDVTGRTMNVARSIVDFASERRSPSPVPRLADKWPDAAPTGLNPAISTPSIEGSPHSGDESELS